MDKLLIIDGSNLFLQMFYGMPSRIVDSQGKAIQGTVGFVGALLKIIRRVKPTHIVAVFDGEHENGRCELDADYKKNRIDYSAVNEAENPFTQLPDVYRALDHLSINYIETADCEADDLIASYVLSYCGDTEIVICSYDSDFFQLIGERVSVLRYRGKRQRYVPPSISWKNMILPHANMWISNPWWVILRTTSEGQKRLV